MAQIIEIENYWQGTKFCCPACGKEVFTEDGGPALKPCEHVLFSWISEVGEIYNPSAQVQRLMDESEARDEMPPSPYDDELVDALPDNAVLFALTEHGMACGPVSLTVVHAINFPQHDRE